MQNDRKNCLIRVSLALGLRQTTIKHILLSVADPLRFTDPSICDRLPVSGAIIEKIRRVPESDIQRFRESMDHEEIDILSILDGDYTHLLKSSADPHGIIFVKGRVDIISQPSV